MELVSRVSYVVAYFNPANKSFNALKQFSELSIQNRVAVVFATALISLLTIGIASVACFRFCSIRLSASAEKTKRVAKKVLPPPPPPLPTRRHRRKHRHHHRPHQTPAPISPQSALENELNELGGPELSEDEDTRPPSLLARVLRRKKTRIVHPFQKDFQKLIQKSSLPSELKNFTLHDLVRKLVEANLTLSFPLEAEDRYAHSKGNEKFVFDTLVTRRENPSEPEPRRRILRRSTSMSEKPKVDITKNLLNFVATLDKNNKTKAMAQVSELLKILTDPSNELEEAFQKLINDLALEASRAVSPPLESPTTTKKTTTREEPPPATPGSPSAPRRGHKNTSERSSDKKPENPQGMVDELKKRRKLKNVQKRALKEAPPTEKPGGRRIDAFLRRATKPSESVNTEDDSDVWA